MSADSMYSDDWNSCLTGSQINAWNLEDDITRIGSKAEDFLSGICGAESCAPETNSRRKAHFNQDSDPFRRFQTPPPSRTSPTPLADLYYQSISQAEVDSDSWQAPEQTDSETAGEEIIGLPDAKDVECMPQDLFSFSQQDAAHTGESSLGTLNRSLTDSERSIVEETVSSSEEAQNKDAPRLLADISKENSERPVKRPLLSLSVGMSICGVGLVFGAQIMHNAAVINPGKSLIIAGLIGLFVSFVFQGVKLLGKRKAA